ncbi:hypothetical protein JOF56_006978 [Kibdelosporangium banguiense]|uniref:Uncharacterized protein n=1 Tax=Kibdelosporangium banguiense TaxID=1365924 RepID=A0ABS4TQB2_9PSEU|nr:hypothetical protein [Kibdelosporangium banguiense]MBP2326593.1 hypothetical protein [Kibdelosporangium banguiense]
MNVEPLDADRIGWVGGIESLTLDGKRYFFGFDYSSDLVLSPLIDDQAPMAAYAAKYMTQVDGAHDEAYWSELVADAAECSSLAEPEDCDFLSSELSAGRTTYHLRYLLGAASSWDTGLFEDDEVVAALKRLGLDHDEDWDSVDSCMELTDPDAQLVVARYFAALSDTLQGNWRTVFAPLIDR